MLSKRKSMQLPATSPLNLADNMSGLPPTPAGCLWAKWIAKELPDTIDITATYPPSRRKLLQNIISQLGKFDLLVKVLHEKLHWSFKHLIHLLSLTRKFSPSTISIWNAFIWKLNSRRLNQKQPPSVCLRNPSSNSFLSFPTLFALPRQNGKVIKNLPILCHC